jgi:quercetin dioxygenase-like cupin family protein
MAIAVNQSTITTKPLKDGIGRQTLLADKARETSGLAIERVTLAAGTSLQCDTSDKALDWLYVLNGEARLGTESTTAKITNGYSTTFPPAFKVSLSTDKGASLLRVAIADIEKLDPHFSTNRPHFMLIDWKEEPVFASKTDRRKRVALVAPGICDTAAVRIDMVIYAAGDRSPSHHCEGAATFMYILEGQGRAFTHGWSSLREGDLIGFADRETHYLKAEGEDLRFLEIFAPGSFKTVWTDPSSPTSWLPTGLNILGGETAPARRERLGFWGCFDGVVS